MGASFAIAAIGVLTQFSTAPPNGGSVWVRVVDEVSGAVFEQEITTDLPANTQFLSPRLFINDGAIADGSGLSCGSGACEVYRNSNLDTSQVRERLINGFGFAGIAV